MKKWVVLILTLLFVRGSFNASRAPASLYDGAPVEETPRPHAMAEYLGLIESRPAAIAWNTLACQNGICYTQDCSRGELVTAHGNAISGDTIHIVSTGSPCSYTSRVDITKNVRIEGDTCTLDTDTNSPSYGTPSSCPTRLKDDNTAVDPNCPGTTCAMIRWTLAAGGDDHRLTNLQFEAGLRTREENNGIIVIWGDSRTNGTRIRMYQNRFVDLNGWNVRPDDVIGVFDHNYWTLDQNTAGIYVHNPDWKVARGSDGFGDRSWYCIGGTGPTGTGGTGEGCYSWGGEEWLYVEDNYFQYTNTGGQGSSGFCIDAWGGSRYVFRFNRMLNCRTTDHGTESAFRNRGFRAGEVYLNRYDMTGMQNGTGDKLHAHRSGSLLLWGNNAVNMKSIPRAMVMNVDRACCYFKPWASADGTGQWDRNDPGNPFFTGTADTAGSLTLTIQGTFPDNYIDYEIKKTGCTPSGNSPTVTCHALVLNNTQGGSTLTWYNAVGSAHGPNLLMSAGDGFTINKVNEYLDGVGRGGGGRVFGGQGCCPQQDANLPANWATTSAQRFDPVYQWLNIGNSANLSVFLERSCPIYGCRPDEHYFDYDGTEQSSSTSPFDGSSGIGVYNDRSRRPTNCTVNTIFWNKNLGSWNLGTNSFYTGQGTADLCVSTNTWLDDWYVPYDYPHPMTQGSTVSIETAADGSGVVVPAQNIDGNSIESITAYCIERNGGAFVSNCAGTWSVANETGGVVDGDLVPAGDNKSATFTGHHTGTANINVIFNSLPASSGLLTVIDVSPPIVGNSGAISCSNVTLYTADCTWTAATDYETPQAQLQYEGCRSLSNNISTVNACEAATIVLQFTANQITFQHTGLNVGTQYFFNYVVMDAAGNKAVGVTTNFTTTVPALINGVGRVTLRPEHWEFQ